MSKVESKLQGYCGDTSDFPTIDRALVGEQPAFEELFQKHRERIFCFFMRYTKGNGADSEDFVQDTFTSAFSKLHTFNKDASFYTWLRKIAVNVFLMSCHRKRYCVVSIEELHSKQVGDGELVIESNPERSDLPWDKKGSDIGGLDCALENVLNQITVEKLMKSLPPGCKKTLALHDLQGFGYKEIAAKFGCSSENAKSQRHRAIKKLRTAVQTASRAPISTNSTLSN